MNAADIIQSLERLISGSKVGLLTTVDQKGFPQTRWMTPALLQNRSGYIYAVTDPDSLKTAHIKEHPQVEWTFQSTVLNEVVSVTGRASLITDSELLENIMNEIGLNLQIFWQLSKDTKNIVIIETEIIGLSCFYPLRNERYTATLH